MTQQKPEILSLLVMVMDASCDKKSSASKSTVAAYTRRPEELCE